MTGDFDDLNDAGKCDLARDAERYRVLRNYMLYATWSKAPHCWSFITETTLLSNSSEQFDKAVDSFISTLPTPDSR